MTPEREQYRAVILGQRAGDWFFASNLEAARADAVASRELAESVGDRESVLDAELLLARIAIVGGAYEDGMREGLRAAREARDAGFESVGVTGLPEPRHPRRTDHGYGKRRSSRSARACSTPMRSSSRTAGR